MFNFGKKKNPHQSRTCGECKQSLKPVRIKKHRDKNGGHHHIILEDFENKHVSVGLTTRAKKGSNSNSTNYKCEINPLGDKSMSYLRRQGTVAPMREYSKQERAGVMTTKDYAQAQEYGRRAKEKYLKKEKK